MSDLPLKPSQARQLAHRLLREGKIRFTGHAEAEMQKDGLEQEDIERVLRSKCEEPEWENNQWRYRFHSYDIWAVTTFRDDELIIIITAWRKPR